MLLTPDQAGRMQSPPAGDQPCTCGSSVPCDGRPFDREHQHRRRLFIRRQLHELVAYVSAGLEQGHPVDELAGHADKLLSPAVMEILIASVRDPGEPWR